MTQEEQVKVKAIHARYVAFYDGYIQGCCLVIADEIQKAIGGEFVAGYLVYNGGCNRRAHWWVEKDGEIIDPMGDAFLEGEGGHHELAHKDQNLFRTILPEYEQYRVPL